MGIENRDNADQQAESGAQSSTNASTTATEAGSTSTSTQGASKAYTPSGYEIQGQHEAQSGDSERSKLEVGFERH